ncbi:MAG: hypothetical protein ABJC12_10425 [Saprospiraceae bacterium]
MKPTLTYLHGLRMRSTTILLMISVLFLFRDTVSAQVTTEIIYKYLELDTFNPAFTQVQKKNISSFWEEFKVLNQRELQERYFKGKTKFGFNGDYSSTKNMYVISPGISISRGTFPSQFRFKYNSDLTLTNNKITENLSNLYTSFDYHPAWGDRIPFEAFTFLSRFTDTYLGVDVRYEIGGGLVLSNWSRKFNKKGIEEHDKTNKVKFDTLQYNKLTNVWDFIPSTSPDHLSAIKVKKIEYSDIKMLMNVQKRINNINVKQNSICRTGLLIGAFFELEKITSKDSITANIGRVANTEDFAPTQKLRFECRPFLDWAPSSSIKFSLRPYFKFPFLPRFYESYISNGEEIKKFDWRLDLESSITISVEGPNDFDGKGVSFSLGYNLYYDNAPQTKLSSKLGLDGSNVRVFANNIHQVIRMEVGVDF